MGPVCRGRGLSARGNSGAGGVLRLLKAREIALGGAIKESGCARLGLGRSYIKAW